MELNTDTLPRLLVDQRYHARGVQPAPAPSQEKTFVSDCMAQANWLVKSLDQRAKTILKVASEIVRQQDGFLAFGVEHLRPLNLKTVADAIGMHEIHRQPGDLQQVHRHAARGVRAEVLLHLLHRRRPTAARPTRPRRAPQDQAADRRRGSDPQGRDVLSDDRIVEILKETGVDIARRTVAKYREALRIPSSVGAPPRAQGSQLTGARAIRLRGRGVSS